MAEDREQRGDLSESELAKAERLLSILERRSEDGGYYFSDAEVTHFLPLVFLIVSDGKSAAELPSAVVQLLGLFASQAGIEPDADPDAVQAAVERYYAERPINPELLRSFQQFVREELSSSDDAGLAKTFATFLGSSGEKSGVLGGGERPPGTTPGGPLARTADIDDD